MANQSIVGSVAHYRGTASQLSALNAVIGAGILVFEIDTGLMKIGDGVSVWNNLMYFFPLLTGTVPPTTSTVGKVGQHYLNTTSGKEYVCTVASTTFTWTELGSGTTTVADASTTVKGIVMLSDATNSTDSTKASTPTAVKSAYDLANGALPKSGGTMTGGAVGHVGTDYTTARFRNIVLSTESPTEGNNGDVWIRYQA